MALTKAKTRMIDLGEVNVKDFGADPTGVSDSAAAIQAAVDASNRVYIPGGTYLITESIILDDNTHIYGDGIEASIIKEGGNSDDFTTSLFINSNYNSSTGNGNITVERLSFHGKNSTPIADGSVASNNKGIGGVYLGYCTYSSILDCFFKDGWTGFNIAGTRDSFSDYVNNRIENCIVVNAASWASNGNPGVPRGILLSSQNSKVINCVAKLCATGYYFGSFDGIMDNCSAHEWTYDNGFYILGDYHKVSNCLAEGNNLGNGFAISYNNNSEYSNCIAKNCSNMGFRIHAPQSATKFTNISAYDCGYGMRFENNITFTPSAVTSSAGVVTVDMGTDVSTNTLFRVGDGIHISGVNESYYNGVWQIESISGNNITFKSPNVSVSPATGTIVVRYANTDISVTNALLQNNSLDAIEMLKGININLTNITVKEAVGLGVQLGEVKNAALTNSTFNDTVESAVFASQSENVTIDGISVFNCKTSADTLSNRGVVGFFEVQGISVTNVKGTGGSVNFIAQLSTETTPSIGYVKNNIRIDADNVDQTYAGVHYEHAEAGAPSITAGIGGIYYRTDGGAGSTLYIKESGTGLSGWVAK